MIKKRNFKSAAERNIFLGLQIFLIPQNASSLCSFGIFLGVKVEVSEGLKFCRNIELQLLAAGERAEGTRGGGREKIRGIE